MTVFWNNGIKDPKAGVDIVGVRTADQAHEARLAGGITTVSQRARYLSLLPWFLDEWYRRRGEEAVHNDPEQLAALARLERLVLFTSVVGADTRETGVLGSDLWADDIRELQAGRAVDLSPPTGAGARRVYAQPCIQLRLLRDGAPLRVLAAGCDIAAARRLALHGLAAVDSIFEGGAFDPAEAQALAPHFAVSGLLAPESSQERALLAALVTARGPSSLGLGETVRWVLASTNRPVAPSDLIAGALTLATVGSLALDGPSFAYAQYELLRRVHFALELCLQAISHMLHDHGAQTARGIALRIGQEPQSELVQHQILTQAKSLSAWTLRTFSEDVRVAARGGRPFYERARDLPPHAQIAYALALLVLAADASRASESLGPDAGSVARRALAVLDGEDVGMQAIVVALLALVVEQHLFTTFRKMADGLPCSLRFVADGPRLRPTALRVRAGVSSDRLTNVMGILSDLGFLARSGRGEFVVTERGRRFVQGPTA